MRSVALRGTHSNLLENALEDYLSGEYDKAFIRYLIAAHWGYTTGASNAAWLLTEQLLKWDSVHTKINRTSELQLARRMLGQAIENGDFTAARTLASLELQTGESKEALRLFIEASDGGDAYASFEVGWMYVFTQYRDLHLAKRFLDLSAEQDSKGYWASQIVLSYVAFVETLEHLAGWVGFSQHESNMSAGSSESQQTHKHTIPSSWVETSENFLLMVLCGLFAVLVYLRSHRL